MPPRTTRKPRAVKAPQTPEELIKHVNDHFPEEWTVSLHGYWYVNNKDGHGYQSTQWTMHVSHEVYGRFETQAVSLAKLWTKFINETAQKIQDAVNRYHEPKRIGGPRVDGPVQRQLKLTAD